MARAGRAVLALLGCAVMAYGAWGLFLSHGVVHLANLSAWLGASVLANDVVLAPIVFALCWAGARVLPAWMRPWAGGALFVAGAAFFVGLPALLRKGRDANPTVLPLDYGRNILVVIGLVIAATIAAAGAASAARRVGGGAGRSRRQRPYATRPSHPSQQQNPAGPGRPIPPRPPQSRHRNDRQP